VAFDRAIKTVEQFGTTGPVERWRVIRNAIHEEVCRRAYDAELGAFVQSYGSREIDASALLIALVGFLPPDHARVCSTVEAVKKTLLVDGFVKRYRTEAGVDGLPPGEGAFLPCSFWLVDNLVLLGRRDEARRLFEPCCRCAMTWDCCLKNMMRATSGCSAISRRRSRISR
jgi:GH15 family glucan-1,4-alpha-glucosidase